MANLESRFLFSISDETRTQLEYMATIHECSSAALIRQLIRNEYTQMTSNENSNHIPLNINPNSKPNSKPNNE